MINRNQILLSFLRLSLFAAALSFFILAKSHPSFVFQEKFNSPISQDFSHEFCRVINSHNYKLIRSFIEENRDKFKAETNKLIASSLKYKNENNFLEAEKSITLASKAAELLKTYFNNEYYINLLSFNNSLSNEEIRLKLKANDIFTTGLKYYAKQEYSEALNKFNQAAKLYKLIGDKFNQCNISYNLGIIYFYLADYDKSLYEYNKALQFAKEIDDKIIVIRTSINTGLIFSNIGNYSKALKYFKIALTESENDPSGLYERYVMNYMANVYYKLGDYETSSKIYHTVLQKSIDVQDSNLQAVLLSNIGLNMIMQNNFKEAEKYLKNCLKIRDKTGNKNSYCTSLNTIAFINLKNGNIIKALNYLEKSLKISKQTENPIILADCLNLLGEAYMKLGDFNKANTYLRECLKVCKNIDSPYLICRFYRNSGLILKNQNRFIEAENKFLQSINLIEQKRKGIEEDYLKSSYLSSIKDIYEDMILFQIEDMDKPISALQYSERSRARAFLDILLGKAKVIPSKKLSFLKRNIEQHKPSELSTLFNLRGTSKKSSINSELNMSDKGSEIISPQSISPFPIEEIQKSLNHNSKIIEYEITKEKIIIWVISTNEINHQIIPLPSEELRKLIITFRNAVSLKDNFLKQYKNWPDRISATNQLAEQLYNTLLAPIRKYFNRGDLLYIIPDDELFYIPFASLMSQEGKYLIEDFNLAYIPSASILKLCLLKNKEKINAEKDRILLIANPVLPLNATDYFPDLNPLSYAEKETAEISDIFSHSTMLMNKEATEINVITKINDFEIIHFATHSLIDERMPVYSSIILSPSEKTSENIFIENPQDGLLMLPEIFSLDLSKTKLVVLSSCDTGLGKLIKGEGIIGLSRAFMYAGTPSILSSLWKVDDKSTGLLFQKFYENIHKRSSHKSQALRYAQLSFIHDEELQEYRHPFFWSSFIILGDGR